MFGVAPQLIGAGVNDISLTISFNVNDYNVRDQAIAGGWDGSTPVEITVTVNPGVIVGASSTGGYAFDTGDLDAAEAVTIVNQGQILGRGGAGGTGAFADGGAGSAGGPALIARSAVTIQNDGVIGGGGGGGGGGAGIDHNKAGGAGGEGAGTQNGGVAGSGAAGQSGPYFRQCVDDQETDGTTTGGTGGAGGALGAGGASGNAASGVYTVVDCGPADAFTFGGGGAAGAAVAGNSFITWAPSGTIHGAIV